MPSVKQGGVLVSLATILAFVAVVVALVGNLGTAAASRQNCRQVEMLKDRVRLNAERSYRELGQNARLLGITLTEEARRKARQDRDRTLREFAPETCSVWLWKQ